MVVTKRTTIKIKEKEKVDWLGLLVITYVALLLIVITILVYTQEGYR